MRARMAAVTFACASTLAEQDAGFGMKRMLDDRPRFQDAIELFATLPTGTPQGSAGFSAGAPTYTLTYTMAFALWGNLGLSITQNGVANAAPLNPAGATRFFSYQPSLTLGYAFGSNFTLLAGFTPMSAAKAFAGSGWSRVMV
ncbi:MAG: hypothetical protein WCE44_12850 [Candidatus Velthaea sp.]